MNYERGFMTGQSCMGGWCHLRETCLHHNRDDRRSPVERMCDPGIDGLIDGFPVVKISPPGSWEVKTARLMSRADVFGDMVGALT